VAGLLLYDADCAFCTRAAAAARRLRLPIDVAPMQSYDLLSLGVCPARARTELPFVADERVRYGAAAIAAALRTGGLPCRVVGCLMSVPPLSWAAAATYRIISRNRHRLPGGTAACSTDR